MAKQYIGIIDDMQSAHDKEIEDMKASLDAALLQLKINKSAAGDKGDSDCSTDSGIGLDAKSGKLHIDISSDDDSYLSNENDMSGLSVSSSDENEPIMNGIRRSRRARIKCRRDQEQKQSMDTDSPPKKVNRNSPLTVGGSNTATPSKRHSGRPSLKMVPPTASDSSGPSL